MPSVEVARLVLGYLSDQGLERTKSAFYQECPDLKSDDFNAWSNQGEKLCLIIEEYFIFKGHDKQSKRTPENIVQLLWKQFDTLVGQLKHSTIHAVKENTKASKMQSVKQGVRVRELNRQNKAGSHQRRNAKSVFVPNPHLVKAKNDHFESVSSHERAVAVCSFTANTIAALGKHDVRCLPNSMSSNDRKKQFLLPSSTAIFKADFQPVTRSGILQGNQFTESDKVVGCFNTSSPKRKSVQPKRRTAVGEITSMIPPPQCSAGPSAVTSTDEIQLDLSSLVEKILGKPEFSEKLAENINRAVEIDIPATPHEINDNPEEITNAATSGAVVNSDKVENIMEMMKTDPMFEELFSSFETFNNSFEEGDCDQNQDGESLDFANQKQALATSDSCASVATDALLLLAKSPGISSSKLGQSNSPVSSFQMPPVPVYTSPSSLSSIVSPASSFPVLMSPGKTRSATNRAAQPIFSHVRQLDFSCPGDVPGESTPGGKSTGKGNTTVDTKGGNLIGEDWKRNVVGYKNISQCSQSHFSENDPGKGEGTSQGPNDSCRSSKNEENSLSVLEELATNAFAQRDGSTGDTEGHGTDLEGYGAEKEGNNEGDERDIGGYRGDLQEDAAENGGDSKGHGRDLGGYGGDLQGDGAETEGNNEGHERDLGGYRGDLQENAAENGGDNEGHGRDLGGYGGDLQEDGAETGDLQEDAAKNGGDNKGHGRDLGGYGGDLQGDGAETEGNNEGHERDLGGYRGDLQEDAAENCVTVDEVKFREFTETKEERQEETTSVIPRNNQHSSPVHDSIVKDCGIIVVDNEGQGGKDIALKTELSCEYSQCPPDDISGDSKEYKGKTSVKEIEVLRCKVNQKTPVTNTTASVQKLQVPKRKLKKNKKSSGTSKKRKTLPLDLDVDKFLSRLHYIEEKS